MKIKPGFGLLAGFLLCLFTASYPSISTADTGQNPQKAKILDSYGKLPLYFIENRGQLDPRVKFYAKTSGQTLYFTDEGIVFDLLRRGTGALKGAKNDGEEKESTAKGKTERLVFALTFDNARQGVSIEGVERQGARVNYLLGNNKAGWKRDIPTYKGIVYKGVYRGIDLKVRGDGRAIKYDFIVNPGADPRDISLSYNGVERLSSNGKGELIIRTAFGELKETTPYVYQEIEGKKVEVSGGFRVQETANQNFAGKLSYSFQVASYNALYPLVIDPTLTYSTYLGGSGTDYGRGIAIDASGNAYVAGLAYSNDFPTQNPYQESLNGTGDAFITKLSATGNSLIYSTYLGGSGRDYGIGIAIDASGNAYVTGYTESTDFPTQNAYQETKSIGSDAFITKLSSTGNSLIYSTYLGGYDSDSGRTIAVDASGNAFVTGYSRSPDFPTQNPYQGTKAGRDDAFITKLSQTGNSLVYSTFLGGGSDDYGFGIAVDTSGNAYVTGQTESTNFPTQNPYQGTKSAGHDAFITKLSATGNALTYSTFLGGTSDDTGYGIAVNASGNAYVTGDTYSINFPTQNPFQGSRVGTMDAFIAKLSATGNALIFSTYLGGNYSERGEEIAVDASGNAYVTGYTYSTNFPTQNPYQGTNAGSKDAFITKLSATGNALVFSTYLGGSSSDRGWRITIDASGNAYVIGQTESTDFPTQNPYQSSSAGGYDVFVLKYQGEDIPPTVTTFTPSSGGKDTSVTITGTNFTGASAVKFGGTDAASFTVDSPTQITATVGTGSTGKVTVITAGGTGTSTTDFTFINAPTISTFFPPWAGTGVIVQIDGTNLSGATAVKFGGTDAASFSFFPGPPMDRILATVGTGSTGKITVTTPGGTATSANDFFFCSTAAPSITSFSPTSGDTGTEVTITGNHFSCATGVKFGGTSGSGVIVDSDTQIRATVGSGSTGKVTVTTQQGGTGTSADDFTFYNAPTITSFDPTKGGNGTSVTITGTNFTGASAVKFGDTAASTFNVDSPTQITASVGTGATGKVTVTTPGGTATSGDDFTFWQTPTVTSFTPTAGGTGTPVTIEGSNFDGTEVKFGGTDAAGFTVDSSTQITATVGAGSTGKVTVTTFGGTGTSADDFTFTPVVPGTYYVNIQTGSDSNDGLSEVHAWKTLHHAIAQINGGAAGAYFLYVGAGTYSVANGEAAIMLEITRAVTIGKSGSGNAIIDGSGGTNWRYGIKISASNTKLSGLHIKGFPGTNEAGVSLASGTGNTIEGCEIYENYSGVRIEGTSGSNFIGSSNRIYHNSRYGIYMNGSDGNKIFSNQGSIYDNGSLTGYGDGIVVDGGNNNLIHDNTIYWSGDANYRQDTGVEIRNAGTGNRIYHNTVHSHRGSGSRGIRVQNCSPEISRNKLYDNSVGIRVDAYANTSPTIKNNLIYTVTPGATDFDGISLNYFFFPGGTGTPIIYHNTIDNAGESGIHVWAGALPVNPIIKYNIISNCRDYGILNLSGAPVIDYNDVWNNTPGNYSGCSAGTHDISQDPKYGSYTLQSDSPCIDAIDLGAGDPVTIDYPGYKRPKGPGKDMGAYEYVGPYTYNYTLPGGTGASTDYRIFTVPLNLGTGADMLTAMENKLGAYAPTHWRVFAFNGANYVEINTEGFASLSIIPGMGFWIITLYNDTVPFLGTVAPDGVDYEIVLPPGWSLVALPWTSTSIDLGNITVTDGVNEYPITSASNTLTQKTLWDYTGSGPYNGYEKRNTSDYALQCGTAYFIKVLAGSNVKLIIPPDNGAGGELAQPYWDAEDPVSTADDEEEPPPPPGGEPTPDIKANGQDGPVTVSSGNPVSIAVSLDPGAWADRNADWWVAAHTPFSPPNDWYTYVYPDDWQPEIRVCIQTPLFNLSPPFEVLNMSLPLGDYTFYFAIDGNADGVPDVSWLDFVEVRVE